MSVGQFEPVKAEEDPAKGGAAFWRAACIYALFCAYGAGSSWLAVTLSWLQLPAYQERFGLDTANKMTIGYQIGTLAVPGFILARFLLSFLGRRVNYAAWIWALLASQAAVIMVGVADARELWVPVSINILGGGLGYATSAVHQAYILMNFDVLYVGAYWIGGDVSGLYAASAAVVQEPGLGEEGRRFSPTAFYLSSLPFVPISMLAFWVINHFVHPGTPPAARKGHIQVGTSDDASLPNAEAISCPKDAEVAAAAAAAVGSGNAAQSLDPSGESRKGALRSLLPGGLRTQPWTSLLVASTTGWIMFGCWGVGDPISSYACANASAEGEGLACLADIQEGDVVVMMIAKFAASTVLKCARGSLKPWIGVFVGLFTVVFGLVFLAASLGGIWSSLGGAYVVVIVLLLRFLFAFIMMLNLAVLQGEYEKSEVEDMNVFTTLLGQGSSVLGTILASVLIAEGGVK